MHEMLTRLLTVRHDIDPGVFLFLEREHGGIAFGLFQRVAFDDETAWLAAIRASRLPLADALQPMV